MDKERLRDLIDEGTNNYFDTGNKFGMHNVGKHHGGFDVHIQTFYDVMYNKERLRKFLEEDEIHEIYTCLCDSFSFDNYVDDISESFDLIKACSKDFGILASRNFLLALFKHSFGCLQNLPMSETIHTIREYNLPGDDVLIFDNKYCMRGFNLTYINTSIIHLENMPNIVAIVGSYYVLLWDIKTNVILTNEGYMTILRELTGELRKQVLLK